MLLNSKDRSMLSDSFCNAAGGYWTFVFEPLHSPDVRLFLSLDNPKNAQVNDDTEQFGADEADLLVLIFWEIITTFIML